MSPPKAQINSINNKESDFCDFAGKDALHCNKTEIFEPSCLILVPWKDAFFTLFLDQQGSKSLSFWVTNYLAVAQISPRCK